MIEHVQPAKDLDARSPREAGVHVARITAMLDRWEVDDVSGEPEWRVEDIEPMTVRHGPVARENREP